MYYYSENSNRDRILIEHVVVATTSEFEPYYYIKIITTYGSKIEWQYTSKELRDKEAREINALRKQKG
jgi:hypothetical protein